MQTVRSVLGGYGIPALTDRLRGITAVRTQPPELSLHGHREASLKHVGVPTASDRAASKWGCGHLCEHGLLEVPASMGNLLAFYSCSLGLADALEHLARFHHCVLR